MSNGLSSFYQPNNRRRNLSGGFNNFSSGLGGDLTAEQQGWKGFVSNLTMPELDAIFEKFIAQRQVLIDDLTRQANEMAAVSTYTSQEEADRAMAFYKKLEAGIVRAEKETSDVAELLATTWEKIFSIANEFKVLIGGESYIPQVNNLIASYNKKLLDIFNNPAYIYYEKFLVFEGANNDVEAVKNLTVSFLKDFEKKVLDLAVESARNYGIDYASIKNATTATQVFEIVSSAINAHARGVAAEKIAAEKAREQEVLDTKKWNIASTIAHSGLDSGKIKRAQAGFVQAGMGSPIENFNKLMAFLQYNSPVVYDEVLDALDPERARLVEQAKAVAEQQRILAENARIAVEKEALKATQILAPIVVKRIAPVVIPASVRAPVAAPQAAVAQPLPVAMPARLVGTPEAAVAVPVAVPVGVDVSQSPSQAGLGGTDLKTVAMIAVPLVILGILFGGKK